MVKFITVKGRQVNYRKYHGHGYESALDVGISEAVLENSDSEIICIEGTMYREYSLQFINNGGGKDITLKIYGSNASGQEFTTAEVTAGILWTQIGSTITLSDNTSQIANIDGNYKYIIVTGYVASPAITGKLNIGITADA